MKLTSAVVTYGFSFWPQAALASNSDRHPLCELRVSYFTPLGLSFTICEIQTAIPTLGDN